VVHIDGRPFASERCDINSFNVRVEISNELENAIAVMPGVKNVP
jgi:hypothetical protein